MYMVLSYDVVTFHSYLFNTETFQFGVISANVYMFLIEIIIMTQ